MFCVSSKVPNIFQGIFGYFGVILQRSQSNPCSANMNLPTTPRSQEFFYRQRWRTQSFCGKFACLIHAVLKLGAELKESNHILLMVQKSGVHQLRLVVYLPLFATGFIYPRWLLRISEPSTVPSIKVIFTCGAMMANLTSLKKWDAYPKLKCCEDCED